jgi:hypothetical protein
MEAAGVFVDVAKYLQACGIVDFMLVGRIACSMYILMRDRRYNLSVVSLCVLRTSFKNSGTYLHLVSPTGAANRNLKNAEEEKTLGFGLMVGGTEG